MATHTTLAMIISNNSARIVVFKTSSESPAVTVCHNQINVGCCLSVIIILRAFDYLKGRSFNDSSLSV